jgi:hypothetical protein
MSYRWVEKEQHRWIRVEEKLTAHDPLWFAHVRYGVNYASEVTKKHIRLELNRLKKQCLMCMDQQGINWWVDDECTQGHSCPLSNRFVELSEIMLNKKY